MENYDFEDLTSARNYQTSIRMIIDEAKDDIENLRLQLHDGKNIQSELVNSINTYLLFGGNLKDLNIAYQSYIRLLEFQDDDKSLLDWFETMDRYNLLTKDLILTSITSMTKRKLRMRLLSKRDREGIQRENEKNISTNTKLELLTYKKIGGNFEDLNIHENKFQQLINNFE